MFGVCFVNATGQHCSVNAARYWRFAVSGRFSMHTTVKYTCRCVFERAQENEIIDLVFSQMIICGICAIRTKSGEHRCRCPSTRLEHKLAFRQVKQ